MSIKLLHTDNLQYMKSLPDNFFDLVLADPEQGKKEHGGKERSRMVVQNNGSKLQVKAFHENMGWDDEPASPEFFEELFRVSRHQVIWGEQYYHRNFGKGRIIWDKVNDGADQFPCEIAFTSVTDRVILLRYMWRGMMQGKSAREGHIQQGNKALNEKIIHPTQKPSIMIRMLLNELQIPKNWKILDTNLGSGSGAVACFLEGFQDYVGIDNNAHYIKGAKDWLAEVNMMIKSSPTLFNS